MKSRANMVYLTMRLKRSTDIEWDDHMKANTNNHALDKIVYDFKAKFRSFWDTYGHFAFNSTGYFVLSIASGYVNPPCLLTSSMTSMINVLSSQLMPALSNF